jgi:hypothetical protein
VQRQVVSCFAAIGGIAIDVVIIIETRQRASPGDALAPCAGDALSRTTIVAGFAVVSRADDAAVALL